MEVAQVHSLRQMLSEVPPPAEGCVEEKMPMQESLKQFKLPMTDVATFMASTLPLRADAEPAVEVGDGVEDVCEGLESISTDASIDLGLADVLPALQVSFILNPQGVNTVDSPQIEVALQHTWQESGEQKSRKVEPRNR
eukprot:6463366-Amphidinium_carterae.1